MTSESQPQVQPESTTTAAEPQRMRILGIHHLTLIVADLNRTTAFYRDLLGMTLVKQTTNADDPTARHFVFGDPAGTPGTVITFFEYPSMDHGAVGTGSTHHFALRVGSKEELEAWREYLIGRGVECTSVLDRTDFHSIYFRDPDGHIVEIATDQPGFLA